MLRCLWAYDRPFERLSVLSSSSEMDFLTIYIPYTLYVDDITVLIRFQNLECLYGRENLSETEIEYIEEILPKCSVQ